MGKRIEVTPWRPQQTPEGAPLRPGYRQATKAEVDALEAYKAAERAKIRARVQKHRAKKAGKG